MYPAGQHKCTMPVHLRLNDKDTTRNPYINFVTALPGPRHDQALHRLQQLAAMVKPLMKDQAFHINSLEEFEHNAEFAGRCWENGEVIELVLTNANGTWIPLQYVLFVFCHELAHIKHMNHIPHLHGALTRQLKQLALVKQKEGYYGDGLWSSGRQLQDGGFKSGLGMNGAQHDLPENVCGGAFRRARATRRPGRRPAGTRSIGGRKFKGPSLHTGAQTAPNTRGGTRRVKLEVAAGSSGSRLDGKDWFPVANAKSNDYKLDENSTFRKRTQSKDAREKRAAAALARFAALQESSSRFKSELKQEVKMESEHKDEDSVTEEEDGDTESEDEEEYDDGDAWLVGNDLHEESRPGIKKDPVEVPCTQADAKETPDQRRRRMRRFDERSTAVSKSDNSWVSLLEGESEEGDVLQKRQRADQSDHSKGKRVKKEEPSSSDDEVSLVKPSFASTVKGRVSTSEQPASRVAPPFTSAEWSELSLPAVYLTLSTDHCHPSVCLLCTLRNPFATQRCAACDTSKGRTTLGA